MDRAAWLAERKKGLGGSDAAAVLGVSPWKSTFALWAEKTGLEPEDEMPEWMEWGLRLEPAIASKYEEVTGRRVIKPVAPITQHASRAYMFATLDYHAEGFGPLEIKTLGFHKADEWNGEPPLHYQIQLQHQMACTNAKRGSFAALIAGQKFVWCDVERNDAFIATLEQKCEEFWDMVCTGKQPPVDGHDSTTDALRRLHPKDSGRVIELPAQALEWVDVYESASASLKKAEELKARAGNLIRNAMTDASVGAIPGGPTITYRANKNGVRTLRIQKETTV